MTRFNFGSRFKKLRNSMKSNGLSCVLINSVNDIYYYTGYRISEGNSGFLKVCSGSDPVLFVSTLENGAFGTRTAKVKTIKKINDIDLPKTVGFDEYTTNAAMIKKLKRMAKFRPAASIIKNPRMIKDNQELEQIKKAIRITKKALDSVRLVGKNENDVAKNIDIKFRENNADNAFDAIVASGKNSSFVHYLPTNRKIGRKDLVVIDLGSRYNYYCSDVSRTFCQSPGKKERALIETVSSIQAKLIDFIEPGIEVKDIEKFYERLMKKEGYAVMHGFGHGVGLNVHEPINRELEKNMVLTVEPGVYIKNFGGCRIEDMVLVGRKTKTLSEKIT